MSASASVLESGVGKDIIDPPSPLPVRRRDLFDIKEYIDVYLK